MHTSAPSASSGEVKGHLSIASGGAGPSPSISPHSPTGVDMSLFYGDEGEVQTQADGVQPALPALFSLPGVICSDRSGHVQFQLLTILNVGHP